jgi:putative endonuclease
MSNGYADIQGRPSADAVRFYYVYILLCADGKPYTGCTDDLKERLTRHQKGNVPATKERLPVKLISYFAFSNKYTAFNFEKYLKTGSGRTFLKKHQIINI